MTSSGPLAEDASNQATRTIPAGAIRLVARSLFWPRDMCWVVLRPLEFFKRRIYRMSVGGSIISALVNLLLAPLIVFGAVVLKVHLDSGPASSGDDFYGDLARALMIAGATQLGILWLVVIVLAGLSSLLYTTAISGCATFGQAFRRSLVVIAAITSVGPVIAVAVAAVILAAGGIWDTLFYLIGYEGLTYMTSAGIWLACAWPLALTFLALTCNGLYGPRVAHGKGEKRCERCGYSLVVLTEEGQCPDCGWPAEDSLEPDRRRPLPAESLGRFPRIPGALAAMWSGFWSPSKFWWRFRVRCDSVAPRNAFLALIVPAAATGALLAMACIVTAMLIGNGAGNIDGNVLIGLFFSFLFSALATLWLVLLGGQIRLLIAVAVARLRGNMMRIDELARVGYCSLGLPAVVESIAAPLAVACFFSGVVISFTFMGPGPSTLEKITSIVFWCVAVVAAVVTAAAALGSLISMIRAMQAARHANF